MGPLATPEDVSVSGFKLASWPSVSGAKENVDWLASRAAGMAFQSLMDAMLFMEK